MAAGDQQPPVQWYRWRVKARLPERFGHKCQIVKLARTMNSILVRFEDGYEVVTSRHYVRKWTDGNGSD